MRTVRQKIYKFSELSKEAQTKAINDCINDMIQYESADHYANWPEFKKAVDEAEAMQTPWFTGEYIWEYCKEGILNTLNDENCEFTKEGNRY